MRTFCPEALQQGRQELEEWPQRCHHYIAMTKWCCQWFCTQNVVQRKKKSSMFLDFFFLIYQQFTFVAMVNWVGEAPRCPLHRAFRASKNAPASVKGHLQQFLLNVSFFCYMYSTQLYKCQMKLQDIKNTDETYFWKIPGIKKGRESWRFTSCMDTSLVFYCG